MAWEGVATRLGVTSSCSKFHRNPVSLSFSVLSNLMLLYFSMFSFSICHGISLPHVHMSWIILLHHHFFSSLSSLLSLRPWPHCSLPGFVITVRVWLTGWQFLPQFIILAAFHILFNSTCLSHSLFISSLFLPYILLYMSCLTGVFKVNRQDKMLLLFDRSRHIGSGECCLMGNVGLGVFRAQPIPLELESQSISSSTTSILWIFVNSSTIIIC